MPLDDTVRFDSLEAQNVSDPLEIDFTDPTQTHEFFAEYTTYFTARRTWIGSGQRVK